MSWLSCLAFPTAFSCFQPIQQKRIGGCKEVSFGSDPAFALVPHLSTTNDGQSEYQVRAEFPKSAGMKMEQKDSAWHATETSRSFVPFITTTWPHRDAWILTQPHSSTICQGTMLLGCCLEMFQSIRFFLQNGEHRRVQRSLRSRSLWTPGFMPWPDRKC